MPGLQAADHRPRSADRRRMPPGGHALSGLIAPERSGSAIDQRELMILVGALGVLLGIAYLATK